MPIESKRVWILDPFTFNEKIYLVCSFLPKKLKLIIAIKDTIVEVRNRKQINARMGKKTTCFQLESFIMSYFVKKNLGCVYVMLRD